MKNNKKILSILLITILLMNIIYANCSTIFAKSANLAEGVSNSEYTDEYIRWSNLSDEEKSKTLMPKKYKTDLITYIPRNMMAKAQMLKATTSTSFNLKNVIPNNVQIRDQQSVGSCWCFAALSSLETNIAMENYKSGKNTSKVYDYSERHMDYATSNSFINNEVNTIGFDREAGSGGVFNFAEVYLMNGYGAINESDIPYENNSDKIDISQIQGKEVQTQLYDTVYFNNYNKLEGTEKQNAMNSVKDFIQNYGSVFCQIHGDSKLNSTCCDITNGAIYCDDASTHLPDHAVSIIGWDDNYDKNNFIEGHRPTSNGAWIVRNSWGTQYGDKGIFYVSYEDANVAAVMHGIKKSKDYKNYDNLYFYDEHLSNYQIHYNGNEIYLGTKYNKKTSNTEYLNQVSVYNYPNYELSVYVNTKDSDLTFSKFQKVSLKEGDTETATSEGFQTLEFAKPIALTGKSYAVIIKVNNKNNNNKTYIMGENKEYSYSSNTTIEKEKCYFATQSTINSDTWQDVGDINSLDSSIDNFDTTIKAYTTNKLYTEELQNIKVTKEPNKTTYYEGENFDKTGMEVTAYYDSLEKKEATITSYTINNGNSLKKGQNSVTISYEGKTTTQQIEVLENKVKSIEITTHPSKTDYYEGEDFDSTGMVITATYDNGAKKVVNDYTIKNGENLQISQNSVTVEYANCSVSQSITISENPIKTLEITTPPSKTQYIEGENFDSTGMVITAIYKDGNSSIVKDYKIINGNKLQKNQEAVIIYFNGKKINQTIKVNEKEVFSIEIAKLPNKTQYKQNKEELDLSGGKIKVKYNNNTEEEIDLKNNEVEVSGFDNKKVGTQTIQVKYRGKEAKFNVEVVELEKPKNSNFKNANSTIKSLKYYTYSDNTKMSHFIISANIDGINFENNNDNDEYYFYISTNENEKNISNWLTPKTIQKNNDGFNILLDTTGIDFSNFDIESDSLKLFIKEVSTKNEQTATAITSAINLNEEENSSIEIYYDNSIVKKEASSPNLTNNPGANIDNNTTKEDKTMANGRIPQTGTRSLLIIFVAILCAGAICLIRYEIINKNMK